MLGTIVGIEENSIKIKFSIELEKIQNLINLHVIMDDGSHKIVGEIVDIKDNFGYINMLGEFINNKFVFGVVAKPSFGASVKLISKEKIPLIIGVSDYQENKDLYLGKSPIYDGVDIGININQFFANHLLYLGQLEVVSHAV